MGFRVPLAIVNKAHQANQLYPFAISLIESVRTYESINERIADKSGLILLIAGMKKEIQSLIGEVRNVRVSDDFLTNFSSDFIFGHLILIFEC